MRYRNLACLALAVGCVGRADVYDGSLQPLGPVSAAGRLVWSVPDARTLLSLDPAAEGPVEAQRLPFEPRALAAAGDRVLLPGVAEDGPRLAVVDLAQGDLGEIPLPAGFDRVLPSPDARHAVLLFDPRRPAPAGAPAARDANEIAVVDLRLGTARRVTLATESVAPRSVVFSPTDPWCAVLLDAAVVVVDLEAPARQLRVPLDLSGGLRLSPDEAIFAPDGRHLFVRASGTADVLALALDPPGGPLSGRVNFLFAPGASRVEDIAVPRGEAFSGQVAAVFATPDGGAIAALLDASGDRDSSRLVPLEARVSRIEELGEGLLLLHDAGGGGDALVAWEPARGRVKVDRLAGAPTAPPAVGGEIAFFPHAAGPGGSAMSAVTVSADPVEVDVRARPLVLGGTPRAVAADPERGRVVLALDVPRRDSGAAPDYDGDDFGLTGSLVFLDAQDLSADGVVLDETVTRVGIVGAHYYALHPDVFGDLTFVPREAPSRAAARRQDGFLLAGLLDLEDE